MLNFKEKIQNDFIIISISEVLYYLQWNNAEATKYHGDKAFELSNANWDYYKDKAIFDEEQNK